eukprot:m.98406 g.98406  ORF g.98406 m.98406 type:complete len:652 (+) comp36986_c0_seq1:15-1970(+)
MRDDDAVLRVFRRILCVKYTQTMAKDLLVMDWRHEPPTEPHGPIDFVSKQLNLRARCFDLWLWRSPPGNGFIDVKSRLPRRSWVDQVETFRLPEPFFSAALTEPAIAARIEKYGMVVLLDAFPKVQVTFNLMELLEKVKEYDCRRECSVLTLCAFKCFPHLPFEEPSEFWSKRRFVRFYGPEASERTAHVIFGPLCAFPASSLVKALTRSFPFPLEGMTGIELQYWFSFVFQHVCHGTVWKIKQLGFDMEEPVLSESSLSAMTALYCHHTKMGWPKGVHRPLPAVAGTELQKQCVSVKSLSCADLWTRGFSGVNMYSDPVHYDFESAVALGVSVIRIGATGDAIDMAYLVDDDDFVEDVFDHDKQQLDCNVGKLKESLWRADKAGLRVIITLCNFPGRSFRDEKDIRLYLNPVYFKRLCRIWELLAIHLADQRHILAGYDLINEPSIPDDNCDIFEVNSTPDLKILYRFYADAIKAIRKHDTSTVIIVESSYWAFPTTFEYMQPFPDPLVVYSFHMYHPRTLTKRGLVHGGKVTYPGKVPLWKKFTDEFKYWDQNALKEFLQPVVRFQQEFCIPSWRIFVGEFGCCREISGASQYLDDLIQIFGEQKWNWCIFSFRDLEWDAMDYELGSDIENMLNREQTELFMTVARHFR